MKILAIETSCDETGIALVEGEKKSGGFQFSVLESVLLSQATLHAPYGGVYPNLAKREHEKNLPVLLEKLLEKTDPESAQKRSSAAPRLFFATNSGFAPDAVAVTVGPGLEPALWTGITFAQKLAEEWKLPLLPVNHMEGHLISSLARLENNKYQISNIKLPVLALLISGGHTEFVLMRDWFEYQIIGETLDDAVGEAFDKVARMLELPYPGGPEISRLADKARVAERQLAGHERRPASEAVRVNGKQVAVTLPRPMLNSKNCHVSFSGLKTAALYTLRDVTKVRPLSHEEKAAFAAEFEDAVADVFVAKARRALEETGAKTFVIGGGVAANRYIRERLQALLLEEFPDVEFRLPELAITGDNAVMIAEAALAHLLSGDWRLEKGDFQEIRAIGNLSLANITPF